MKKLKAFVLTTIFTAVVLIAVLSRKHSPPQIITLPNGETYEFAGVTWGTDSVPPTLYAQVAHRLPAPFGNWLRNRYPKRLSQTNLGEKYPKPRLFIWYRRVGTNAAAAASRTVFIPTAVLADEAGVKGGSSGYPIFANSVTWSFVSFPVVPRRSRVLQCQFYPSGYGHEAYSPFCTIRFPNPLYGQFPQWQAESLPIVKQSGDLEVRLDAVTSGHPESGATIMRPNGSRAPRYSPISGGERIQAGIDISVRSAKGTNETWIPHHIVLTDAIGNVLESTSSGGFLLGYSNSQQSPGWKGYCEDISGTLWADEAAWRLKLEMKRAFGFPPEDMVTFKKVPVPAVGATNFVPITNIVGGMQIVLRHFVRCPNIAENGFGLGDFATQIRVELLGKPGGVALDFLDMTTDAGPVERYGYSYLDSGYRLAVKSIPTNATTANITWVVQKTRTVEFLLKPPKIE